MLSIVLYFANCFVTKSCKIFKILLCQSPMRRFSLPPNILKCAGPSSSTRPAGSGTDFFHPHWPLVELGHQVVCVGLLKWHLPYDQLCLLWEFLWDQTSRFSSNVTIFTVWSPYSTLKVIEPEHLTGPPLHWQFLDSNDNIIEIFDRTLDELFDIVGKTIGEPIGLDF